MKRTTGTRSTNNLLLFPDAEPVPQDDLPSDEATATRPPDWRERERALDVQASWIVEAPAGSGKTGLLIQRYLKLLADGSVREPEQVLAITFTNKATAELRERVVGQLEAAAAGAGPVKGFDRQARVLAEAVLARDGAAGWGLIEHPRRLNIRTIDSVCAEISRSLPVLSSSGGRQAPTTEADRLYREAARRTLKQLGGEDAALHDALRTVLLHRDGNLAECEGLIAAMLGWRDQWGQLVPLRGEALDEAALDATILPKLERALDVAICQALTQLSESLPAAVLEELTAVAAEFAVLEGYNGDPSPIAMCAGRMQSPEALANHLAHWRALVHLLLTPSSKTWRRGFNVNHVGFKTGAAHRARLKEMVEALEDRDDVLQALCQVSALPPARYPEDQWRVAKALFRVLSHALVELQLVFAETGECDFVELSLAARSALTREGAVEDLAAALGVETMHLLVDEMQDTSTGQYELIERLTQGWDGFSQTVFLVGDPKQSIYRFRQARVERFGRMMQEERLGELPLGRLRLTANFRSQRRLVEQFNEGFSRVFPPVADVTHPEEVPYTGADAVRDVSAAEGLVWHARAAASGRTDDETKQNRRRLSRENARAVRRIAADWMARPLPEGRSEPWRIAVLVRSRQHLAGIVTELNREGVPFRAVEIEALGERQEILDLLALTRALLHPADRVAWLAVLHAPWCGLGLADLHRLAGGDDEELKERCVADLIRERGHMLSEDGEERLARIWPVLDAADGQRGRMPAYEWVERTWRSLGGDSYLDEAERANAMRFFRLLEELEAETGRVDPGLLAVRTKKLYAQAAVHPGAVDLMTIHGSKGLEWDVVMVPGLEKRSPPDRGYLLNWMEIDSGDEGVAHMVLAPIVGKGEDARDLNAWIRFVHGLREAAERKRLFYVACTRAREELHLFAAPDRSSKGEVRVEPSSTLKTAWPVAKVHFDAQDEEEQEAFPGFEGEVLAIAAVAEKERPPVLRRVRAEFDPAARFAEVVRLPYGEGGAMASAAHFERPEGSFAARAFGNAVHAFLEIAAQRMAEGATAARLLGEISGWQGRVEGVLRADGLAPAVVSRLGQRVLEALRVTLSDADGVWILSPHAEASSEVAMTGWAGGFRSVRLDRMFRAGAAPGSPGESHLWIVDYKTATHGSNAVEEFLAREREKYKAQLEAYARTLARLTPGEAIEMRVALYYPVLAKLTWWVPELA